MGAIQYVVQRGDSLAGLAEEFLGDDDLWPMIYEHNNEPAVVARNRSQIPNPNMIFVGQRIEIPLPAGNSAEPHSSFSAPPASAPSCELPSSRPPVNPNITLPRDTPTPQVFPGSCSAATQCTHPTFQYDLDLVPEMVIVTPFWTARLKWGGSIQLQNANSLDFATITQAGFELSAKSDADEVLDVLIRRTAKLDVDFESGRVGLETGISVRANNRYAPTVSLSTGIGPSGRPMIRGTVQAEDVRGQLGDFAFVVAQMSVSFTIEMNAPPGRPRPSNRSAPSSHPTPSMVAPVIIAAVVVAGLIYGASVVASGGATLAGAPVAYSLAAAALVGTVGVGSVISEGRPVGGI